MTARNIKELRAQRLKDGLCVYCGNPAQPGANGSMRWCDRCRKRHQENRRNNHTDSTYRENLKIKATEVYGGKCETCGHSDYRVLTFHHVNGDGKQERGEKNKAGSYAMHRDAVDNGRRPDIQLLCANCHYLLHWERSHYRPDNRGRSRKYR